MVTQSLEDGDDIWYKEKLGVLGLVLADDPLNQKNEKQYSTSKDGWPIVEMGQIFEYFIDSHGLCTDTSQRANRSMGADKFVRDGFVRTVYHVYHRRRHRQISQPQIYTFSIMAMQVMRSRVKVRHHIEHGSTYRKMEQSSVHIACACMAGYVHYFVLQSSSTTF